MLYRVLGQTGLKVSALSIGGGAFNTQKDPLLTFQQVKKAISLWVKGGCNIIDTGKEYDESFISKALGKYKKRLIVVARSEARDGKNLLADIKDSIRKLGIRPIPIYEVWESNEGILETLREAKKREFITYAGIFNHRIEVVRKAIESNEFKVVTILYNVVHRMAEKIFPLTKKLGLGIMAAAPLATGIVVDPGYEKDEVMAGVETMTAQNALSFVLSNEHIHTAIVGAKKSHHIKSNIEVVKAFKPLSKDQLKKLRRRAEKFLGKNFCRMCRYCICPIGIPIPDLLKIWIRATRYGYVSFAKWQYANMPIKADACTECGECEKTCPYSLPIIKILKEMHSRLIG
jgi:hypothetical protein